MAKTTGKISGTLILVSAAGETITCSTGCTLTITNERIETTCKDDAGAGTYTAGKQDWSLQVDGITKYDTVTNFSKVAVLAKNATVVTWQVETGNAEDPYFEGDGFVGDFTYEGPLNAPSTWSITASPTGPLYLFNT